MTARFDLMLIPGLLSDKALWQFQVNALKDIADCYIADTAAYESIHASAKAILAQAPASFALGGLSMGGYIALEIMRVAPERVTKLVLMNTSARPDTPEQKQRRRLLLTMSLSGQFKGVTPRLLPMLIHPDRLDDRALTQIIMDMAERVGRGAFQNQQTALLGRIDSRPFLATIKCPTLIIGGAQDTVTPPDHQKEMASAVPGAHCVIIEKCGHLSALEKPNQVNELLRDWLKL